MLGTISARELALQVLCRVEKEGAYANLLLDHSLEKQTLDGRERALATELVYGTLRHLLTIDYLLHPFLRRPLNNQDIYIRNILRLAVYQLEYLSKIPAAAACHEAVKLARRYGGEGAARFVNGVLRNFLRRREAITFPAPAEDPVEHLAVVYSHPRWLVKRWLEMYGFDDTRALCAANNQPAPHTIRTNTLRTTRAVLQQVLSEAGVMTEPTDYAPEGLIIKQAVPLRELAAFRDGLFFVQDESSMLAVHALAPERGEKVLDAAAAPGGKTTHIAQLMGDEGEITAVDIHPHKINLIVENCRRLGITCVRPQVADLRQPPAEWRAQFDRILLDAPCSGLGVLRRRPDLRWRKSEGNIAELAQLQRQLLTALAPCLKVGGVLVYSTCTITREENEEQVNAFLANHPSFVLEDLQPVLGHMLDAPSLTQGWLQLLPHRHGTDGFFIARLRRRG